MLTQVLCSSTAKIKQTSYLYINTIALQFISYIFFITNICTPLISKKYFEYILIQLYTSVFIKSYKLRWHNCTALLAQLLKSVICYATEFCSLILCCCFVFYTPRLNYAVANCWCIKLGRFPEFCSKRSSALIGNSKVEIQQTDSLLFLAPPNKCAG